MMVAIGAVTIGSAYLYYRSQKNKPIQIGIAVEDESEEMELALKLVTSMGVVRNLCTFIETDEEGIYEGVISGKLSGGIILSNSFHMDMKNGLNTPARIVLPEEETPGTGILAGALSAGVSMVDTVGGGIHAMKDAAAAYDVTLSGNGLEDIIMGIYQDSVLKRGEFFDTRVLSPLGEFSIYDYYTSSAIVIVIMLSGIYFGFLFTAQNRAVEDKLTIYGINAFYTGLIRVVVMTGFVFLTALVLRLAAYIGFSAFKINIDRLRPSDILCLVPVSISVAALFYFIFTVGEETYRSRILLLLIIVIMLLSGGFFIPIEYLPEWGRKISYILPAALYRSFLLEAQKGALRASTSAGIVFYTLLFFAAGIGVRWKRH
ncbi:MAG: ABC transporter permease [Lachnospiraceae bacterium]|nr:ABC transporter permease [Lachnospiraceae bacterium]